MTQSRFIVLLSFILCTLSCDFSDDIINEEAINEASLEQLFEPTITQIAYNQSAFCGRSAALLMQYYRENESGINYYTTYNIDNAFANFYWDEGLYTGSLKQIQEISDIAEKENNDDLKAISLILFVNEYLMATTIFGDIPFSEALQPNTIALPKFDTQESIYTELLSMIDEATNLIGSGSENSELADIDIIYEGNMENWNKYAYGLKARIHLHLTNNQISTYLDVLSALEKSFNYITEQPNYNWAQNSVQNPLFTYAKSRPRNIFISEKFSFRLTVLNDPRLDYITDFNTQFDAWDYQKDPPSELYWTTNSTSLPLLSYAEVQFMKAEALLMINQSDDEISEALKKGIEASCQEYGLSFEKYQEYSTKQSSLTEYNTNEEKLEHIIIEAYKAYYGYGFLQAWNNYKRLRLPKLVSTGIPSEINPSASIPVRLLYPRIETQLNPDNTNEAVLRQNGALLDNDIWVFQ